MAGALQERPHLGGERRVGDLGNIPFAETGNPYGVLERYQNGEIQPVYQDFSQVEAALAEATGVQLPHLLVGQLGLHKHHYVLIDHPHSVTSVFLGTENQADLDDPLQKASAAIVIKRAPETPRQAGHSLYVPTAVKISGKDRGSFLRDTPTNRALGVTYGYVNDGAHPEIAMRAVAMDVAILQEENPTASPKDYRFMTLPIPTPTGLSWHNMDAAGFITEGMIEKDFEGNPIYPMVVKGRIWAVYQTDSGRFRFTYRIPLSQNAEPLEHNTIAADFHPSQEGRKLRLAPWEVETAMHLIKAK